MSVAPRRLWRGISAVTPMSARRRGDPGLRHRNEGDPDAVLLDPGDLAIAHDRGVAGQHQAKALRTKAGSLTSMAQPSADLLSRVQRITDPPAETKVGFVHLGPRKPASLFHLARSGLPTRRG